MSCTTLSLTRTGRCDYYQDFGHKATTVRVGVWCKGCKAGMHRECYYYDHQLWYGVFLDNRYEVNKSRVKQGTRVLVPKNEAKFTWRALRPDIHSSESEVESHGSQERSGSGSWEASMEEEENADAQRQPPVPQDNPKV